MVRARQDLHWNIYGSSDEKMQIASIIVSGQWGHHARVAQFGLNKERWVSDLWGQRLRGTPPNECIGWRTVKQVRKDSSDKREWEITMGRRCVPFRGACKEKERWNKSACTECQKIEENWRKEVRGIIDIIWRIWTSVVETNRGSQCLAPDMSSMTCSQRWSLWIIWEWRGLQDVEKSATQDQRMKTSICGR